MIINGMGVLPDAQPSRAVLHCTGLLGSSVLHPGIFPVSRCAGVEEWRIKEII
jgi:hypothetical protein